MGGGPPRAARPEGPTTATVYVLAQSANGGAKPVLRPVTIKAGISDGSNTEVLEGLNEGDVVVTGTASSSSTSTTAAASEPPRNPFSPFGGGRRR
jgi:HlyD family secretion protein